MMDVLEFRNKENQGDITRVHSGVALDNSENFYDISLLPPETYSELGLAPENKRHIS